MLLSVIIPALNAGKEIANLIELISRQSVKPDEIIVVDSASDDDTVVQCGRFSEVRVIPISRSDFDHGGTRDMALRQSKGDIVVFMTQDAIPKNEYLLENLLKAFDDSNVACAMARQLPKPDATPMEIAVRKFNYPATSFTRSLEALPKYGIKTYFFSDVCAAYRRDIYLKLGGFEHPLKTNEDMFYAANVIRNGYKTAYVAVAEVLHSHNFSLKEQYERNYLIGFELARHKDILGETKTYGEGLKLVRQVCLELLKQGHVFSIVRFFFDCVARVSGNWRGKRVWKG
ncbi:MAG: glycosyltransferase [Phascolarctobacterium sp.]|nr:glycosyltransferase [Phascolarctobacterium sp.]